MIISSTMPKQTNVSCSGQLRLWINGSILRNLAPGESIWTEVHFPGRIELHRGDQAERFKYRDDVLDVKVMMSSESDDSMHVSLEPRKSTGNARNFSVNDQVVIVKARRDFETYLAIVKCVEDGEL